MVDEAGSDRVGIKISPEMNFNDISDATPQGTYTYLVEQLRGLDLAYLHVALFGATVDYHAMLRPRFNSAYLIGGGLDRATAEALLAEGRADATVFGSSFLANPDLPVRFRQGAHHSMLRTVQRSTREWQRATQIRANRRYCGKLLYTAKRIKRLSMF